MSFHRTNKGAALNAKDVTDVLRRAMTINFHCMGIPTSKISARSLRTGGAMVMFCGNLNLNNIWIMGRWYSDAMMRYLHIQAQPII
jgi:hypothetical protein